MASSWTNVVGGRLSALGRFNAFCCLLGAEDVDESVEDDACEHDGSTSIMSTELRLCPGLAGGVGSASAGSGSARARFCFLTWWSTMLKDATRLLSTRLRRRMDESRRGSEHARRDAL